MAENGDGLVQRHKVTALATCRLFVRAASVFTKRHNLVVEFGYSSFEFQNFRDAGEIHAVFHQLVDARQALEVGVGIATIAARRAGRFKQTLALINTQGLRMHAGKFSGDGDHIDGTYLGVKFHGPIPRGVLGETLR